MANKQHAKFSDENGNIFYLENETEDVLDPSGKPLSNGGDLSEASVTFTPDATRKLPQSGGRFKAFLGSIVKYLTDLGAAAYLAVANNCTTTQAGSLLDARQGKVLMDKANQLSSELNNKVLLNMETWNGSNYADDFRGYNVAIHVNASGAFTHGFPTDIEGIFISCYSSSVTQQTYYAVNGNLYTRVGKDGIAFTPWVSFQDGVDTLYSKCVSCGWTPTGKNPTAISDAIQGIYNNRYTEGYNDGYTAGQSPILGEYRISFSGNMHSPGQLNWIHVDDVIYISVTNAGVNISTVNGSFLQGQISTSVQKV